jgi:hypothetical protein
MCRLQTQKVTDLPEESTSWGWVQAASDVHNPMTHPQACKHPIKQGIYWCKRKTRKSNSIPPIKAKVWDLLVAKSDCQVPLNLPRPVGTNDRRDEL